MATSSKFDLSSGSPDRPPYTGGQRGSHLSTQLDRLGSFRESMENPILSSLPNMMRSSSVVSQGDMVNFFRCLRFDPKVVAEDHKSSRQGDFKRHINVAFGISVDDSPSVYPRGKLPSSPPLEEIKRVKASLRESSVKARERMKIFNEALSVFNKFFPTVPSKKRSRVEGFSNDRSSTMSPSDRLVMGLNLGKTGIQNHVVAGGFELEQKKLEERAKNSIPKKRTRTSLVDGRMDVKSSAIVRQSGTVDRDKEILRPANSGAIQGDERTLSIGVDGWENTKMKKRRSGIKPDVSASVALTKPTDGYREPRHGMQQRPATDARSRLNSNSQSHGFRQGVANGAVGVGKPDGISQPTCLSVRSSIPRTDLDNSSPFYDRRERPIGSDKERVNLKAVNKSNIHDDFNSASPTSSTKMNASIRAPRSGVAPKLSPAVHRATASNDWELSHCTNKPPSAGTNNRKRTTSTRSSSPPVAHWAGQRPQKISRTARRTNLVPIVSNNDEIPALDTVSDVSGNEIGLGYARHFAGNSPQQVKLKGDHLFSAVLSESEESGAPEIKSKDKGKNSDDIDEKAGHGAQKVSTLGQPSRKNKLVIVEDLGDSVRRQGRTGRSLGSTRSLMPLAVEKLGNVGTAKQLRSAGLGFDKNGSKVGRPPTRKLSDHKAYPRQKNTMVNTAADFVDDGHEELLAAASAVISSANAFSNSFWRQMESYFGFISDVDITYWTQQGNLESAAPSPTPVPYIAKSCSTVANGYGMIEHEGEAGLSTQRSSELLPELLVPGARDIPLFQRLIAAIISGEDCNNGNGDLEFDAYGTGFELDGKLVSNGLNHLDNFKFSGHAAYNGYTVTGKQEHDEAQTNILGIPNMGISSTLSHSHSTNGTLPDQALVFDMACSEFEYDNMQMNERLCLEVQSIGIFPESMSDMQMGDEGIRGEIDKLEEKHCGQVLVKKGLLDKLLKSASKIREFQEKEFDQLAHDKLVIMAYEKYMTCWGPNATAGKGSSNKMARQAALAFVKRTLERCHKFEDTSQSCFSEPLFKDMFISHLSGVQSVHAPMDGESAKLHANTSSRSSEARVSVSTGSQPSPRALRLGQNGDGYVSNSSNKLPPVNSISEQTTGREDMWSNRVKKRELLLDDVVGASSGAPSGIGGSLSSSTKGKRSERDREGKGHSREVLSSNGTIKTGRQALSNVKGERKSRTKPKQKTQLSVSVNGLVGNLSDQPNPTLHSETKASKITGNNNSKEEDGFRFDVLDDPEAIDLSNLQLPGMDDDGQGQDYLGSWLNIDDDVLQDHDTMGLEIPMDDLGDLKLMV